MLYHFVKREKKDVKYDDPLTFHLSLFTSEGNTTYYNTFTNIIIIIKMHYHAATSNRLCPVL